MAGVRTRRKRENRREKKVRRERTKRGAPAHSMKYPNGVPLNIIYWSILYQHGEALRWKTLDSNYQNQVADQAPVPGKPISANRGLNPSNP